MLSARRTLFVVVWWWNLWYTEVLEQYVQNDTENSCPRDVSDLRLLKLLRHGFETRRNRPISKACSRDVSENSRCVHPTSLATRTISNHHGVTCLSNLSRFQDPCLSFPRGHPLGPSCVLLKVLLPRLPKQLFHRKKIHTNSLSNSSKAEVCPTTLGNHLRVFSENNLPTKVLSILVLSFRIVEDCVVSTSVSCVQSMTISFEPYQEWYISNDHSLMRTRSIHSWSMFWSMFWLWRILELSFSLERRRTFSREENFEFTSRKYIWYSINHSRRIDIRTIIYVFSFFIISIFWKSLKDFVLTYPYSPFH